MSAAPRAVTALLRAHALLLGYLEGQPMYNACNFNWVVEFSQGFRINLTASNTVSSGWTMSSCGT